MSLPSMYSLYDHYNPTITPFSDGIPYEVKVKIDTPSSLISLAIHRVDLIRDQLFVLLEVISPKEYICGEDSAESSVTVTLPSTASTLKTSHYILNCDWNWGHKVDTTYVKNEDEYQSSLNRAAVTLMLLTH